MTHKCYLCGHCGEDVNHILHRYVGGEGYVAYLTCDNISECHQRIAQLGNCKHCGAEMSLDSEGTCIFCGRPHDKEGNLLIPHEEFLHFGGRK